MGYIVHTYVLCNGLIRIDNNMMTLTWKCTASTVVQGSCSGLSVSTLDQAQVELDD